MVRTARAVQESVAHPAQAQHPPHATCVAACILFNGMRAVIDPSGRGVVLDPCDISPVLLVLHQLHSLPLPLAARVAAPLDPTKSSNIEIDDIGRPAHRWLAGLL